MRCTRCVMDDSVPGITFDSNGVCNFCHDHDIRERHCPTDGVKLSEMIAKIKEESKSAAYDCIVGISGGADSSYLLYLATKVWKLRTIALHFDNGWNTDIANHNIDKILKGMNVPCEWVSPSRAEFDSLCKAFLQASVPDADIPNDIGMTATFYKVAEKLDVKNVLIGHSFRTEGSVPLGWTYMDGKYIQSVAEKFGVTLKTFTNLWLDDWLRWIGPCDIKVLRPYWYMNYDPDEARRFLAENYKWEWYGGKHSENKYTKFIAYYYLPKKFGIDKRLVRLSAPVRSGFMTRGMAIKNISEPPTVEKEILKEVKSRLNLTDSAFYDIMHAPNKTHLDYETYQSYFKSHKDYFRSLLDKNLIPETFYKKYVEG